MKRKIDNRTKEVCVPIKFSDLTKEINNLSLELLNEFKNENLKIIKEEIDELDDPYLDKVSTYIVITYERDYTQKELSQLKRQREKRKRQKERAENAKKIKELKELERLKDKYEDNG